MSHCINCLQFYHCILSITLHNPLSLYGIHLHKIFIPMSVIIIFNFELKMTLREYRYIVIF